MECDFLPSHIRFVGKRAEKCDPAASLNRVGDLEVHCLPVALDRREDKGPLFRLMFLSSC
jgi:hypothetical protein